MIKSFLTYHDYNIQIQKDDFFQILGEKNIDSWFDLKESTQDLILDAEQVAIEEIKSYLRGRYMVDEIFAPTQEWASGTTFFAKNMITYSEPRFNTGTTYQLNDRFNYKGDIYKTVISGGTTGITPSLTASTPYQFIIENNSFYYANLPILEFDTQTSYYVGSLVWFQDNIYQAKQNIRGQNPAQSQNLELRYGIPSAQGYLGWFGPDTNLVSNPLPSVNTNYWTLYNGPVNSWFTGTTYYFSGQTPDNTTYWTQGDNRNPQIKMYLIDIILYHLHSRINPRNIPELRAIRYDGNNAFQSGGAIGWMKNVEKGKVNLNVPEVKPNQGGNIRWGSYPKNSNTY